MKVNSKHKSKDKILFKVKQLNNKHNLTLLCLIHQQRNVYYQIHKPIYYIINKLMFNKGLKLLNHK